MTWSRNGTVNVTYGSDIVTGNETWWLTKAKTGDAISIDGSELYEIKSVESNGQITLTEVFNGYSRENTSYYILPLNNEWAVNNQLVASVNSLMATVNASTGQTSTVKGADKTVKADSQGSLWGWLSAFPEVTATNSGMMTSSDKIKLDSLTQNNKSAITPETAGVIDCSKGDWFVITSSANVTITLTNIPFSGTVQKVTLEIVMTDNKTVYWPSNIKWSGGQPEISPSTVTTVTLVTSNGGLYWLGSWKTYE